MLSKDLQWNGRPIAGRLRGNRRGLLTRYLDSGLVADDIKPRLTSPDIGVVFPHVWEALPYRQPIRLQFLDAKGLIVGIEVLAVARNLPGADLTKIDFQAA